MTRRRISSDTALSATGEKVRLTVACDTPASRATSMEVTEDRRRAMIHPVLETLASGIFEWQE
jgi:hypothetical protein